MIGSNFDRRSVIRSFLDRGDQLTDILDLGLLIHRDENVEFIFDVGDEIEDGQACPFEVWAKRVSSVTATPFC